MLICAATACWKNGEGCRVCKSRDVSSARTVYRNAQTAIGLGATKIGRIAEDRIDNKGNGLVIIKYSESVGIAIKTIGCLDGYSLAVYLLVSDRLAEQDLFMPDCYLEFPLVTDFEGVGAFHYQLDVFGIGSRFYCKDFFYGLPVCFQRQIYFFIYLRKLDGIVCGDIGLPFALVPTDKIVDLCFRPFDAERIDLGCARKRFF